MPENTAVREVYTNGRATDNGASRPLTITDIENFAASMKALGATDKPNAHAQDLLPYIELTDDAPVSRCGKPKDYQINKCIQYDDQPVRKEQSKHGRTPDEDAVRQDNRLKYNEEPKIHRPMLDEEPKIHRPMINEEPGIHRPIQDDEIKIHKPIINDEIQFNKPIMKDVQQVHNIGDTKAIGNMVNEAVTSHSRDAERETVSNLADLAHKVLEKSHGSLTALRQFEKQINANVGYAPRCH